MSGLRVEALTAGYGRMDVLRGISLHVHPGEMVALLGRNGAGKSTLLRSIAGLQPIREGQVTMGSAVMSSRRAWQTSRLGVTMVLEGARVFATQSVADNLAAGRLHSRDVAKGDRRLSDLLDVFPALREKSDVAAGSLSGGERMQLAIAQAVVASPRFLLLDEPSVGLSPALVQAVFGFLDSLRREGENDDKIGLLVAEQMIGPVLRVADRAVVLDHGGIVARGTAAELRTTPALIEAYLGATGV